MSMNDRRAYRSQLWFGALTAFGVMSTGCGALLGPDFHDVKSIPPNAGIVYIYRPSRFLGHDTATEVRADGVNVGYLFSSAYVPYYVTPGEHTFRAKNAVRINAVAGQTYYVKYTMKLGLVAGVPELTIETPTVGADEIRGCALLPGGYDGRDRI